MDPRIVAEQAGKSSYANPPTGTFVGRAAPQASEGDDNDDMLTRLALAPDGARAFTLRGYEESEDGTVTVSVFDIRPASSIRRLGTVNVQFVGWAQDYTILGGEDEILIAVGSDVVRIDVSESGKPTARTRYRTSANIEGLARQGQLIVVAASEDGVQLFELPLR